jgi:uncharacterized membrane protein
MVVLIFAIRSNAKNSFQAAYCILIIAAICAGIAYGTGESAEETVEHIAGVSETSIESHEEVAQYALGSFIVLGVLAAVGLYVSFFKENQQVKWGALMLIASLFSFSVIARTAWLGGKIRHTELSQTQAQNQMPEADDED